MKNINYCFTILLMLLLASCSKEEEIDLSIVDLEAPYTFDDSPLGQRLKGIYDETGTYVLYQNIRAQDWTWNFDRSSGANWRANGMLDPQVNLPPVLDYLEQYWFNFYPQSFLRNFLPYRIIISDSLVNGNNRFQFLKGEGMQAFSARLVPRPGANMAVTTRVQTWADSTKKRVARDLHIQQYLETVGNKLARELPDSFFLWSSYDYTVSTTATAKNPKELGFWNLALSSDGSQRISPARGIDVTDWLKTIIATRPEDMQALFVFNLSGVQVVSEPMKQKYAILQKYLADTYNMNFHTLNVLYQ